MNIAKACYLLKRREIRLELKREDHAQVQIRLPYTGAVEASRRKNTSILPKVR